MRVVICGGGAIGTSIAYFLARRGAEAIVVERAGIANAASGKSGGFLALDWCDGTPLQALARRSFALHARLAEELDGDWGYRRMTTYGGLASAENSLRSHGNGHPVDWVSEDVVLYQRLGSMETTAQVHPGAYTARMLRAAEAHGARLVAGEAQGIARRGGRATGVLVDGDTLDADTVLVAMGPWSILASEWLDMPAVYGLKGHSIVFDTGTRLPAEALFIEYQEPGGAISSPEVFPRADGTTYVCGISSERPLPIDPLRVSADEGALDRLQEMCARISPVLAEAKILARQACFRPVTQDGLPLIGAVPEAEGVYVATGHSVWGILNAPATGEAMAELILDGKARSVDLKPFVPGRLNRFDPARLRKEALA
ncbi:MAG: NAD(P)/FAD-dependent oxidoreductase [Propylenella sp.]